MEGKPERLCEIIRENPRKLLRNFVSDDTKFIFLDAGESILPSITWVGLFHSVRPTKTFDSDYQSELCICWFSEFIPNNLSKMINEVFEKINWIEQAEDFDITFI